MRLATLLSLSAGILLVSVKGIAWLVTDSLSLMSSLADSMLDVIASFINFVAVRYALQPADDEHRFGHGKAEDLATLAQSTFICGSGLFLVIEGIKRMMFPEPVHHNFVGVAIMLFSITVTFGLVMFQRHVVHETGSSAIKADSSHYYSDFLSNGLVIIALLLSQWFSFYEADAFFALCIAGYLIYTSITLGYHALQNLMDREFSDSQRNEIEMIVRGIPEVLGLHDLRTRKSGLMGFIQLHLDLEPDITLRQAHVIADRVEEALKAAFPNTEILIHQDPLYGDK